MVLLAATRIVRSIVDRQLRPHERPGAHLVESRRDCLDRRDKALDRSELAKKTIFPKTGLNLPACGGD
jgi:hypothetical protein